MKLSFKKLAASATLLAAVGSLIATSAPAGAVPAADGKPQYLNFVGSDTIYWVSNGLTGAFNTNLAFNVDKDVIVNTTPVVTSPFPTGSIRPLEPASDTHSHCNSGTTTETYSGSGSLIYDAGHLPPNGSSAGVSALGADTNGCIAGARSSRQKSASDPTTLDFYAFALDALGIVQFPGGHQPANLTRQQVHDIYTCNASGVPIISNWSQVGGVSGVIKKYAPQTQSGSYKFLVSQYLGGVDVDTGCNASHKTTFLEEHDARGVIAANKADAILPFSFAQWTSDANAVTPDLRNGVVFGKVDGVAPSTTTINEQLTGTSGHFNGTRYVNYVVKTTSPLFSDAIRFAGVDNAGAGFMCAASAHTQVSKILSLYGFVPLTSKATGGGVTIASFCRKNAAAL